MGGSVVQRSDGSVAVAGGTGGRALAAWLSLWQAAMQLWQAGCNATMLRERGLVHVHNQDGGECLTGLTSVVAALLPLPPSQVTPPSCSTTHSTTKGPGPRSATCRSSSSCSPRWPSWRCASCATRSGRHVSKYRAALQAACQAVGCARTSCTHASVLRSSNHHC